MKKYLLLLLLGIGVIAQPLQSLEDFDHPALHVQEQKDFVYTAQSKYMFYLKDKITAFVLKEGYIPLNPFMSFGFGMNDLVPLNTIRNANNNFVTRADEIWVFGPISDGVLAEVLLAKEHGKKVRYFLIDSEHPDGFIAVNLEEMTFEDDLDLYVQAIEDINSDME